MQNGWMKKIMDEFKKDDIRLARKVLSDLCSNKGRYFRMTVPVQDDDSDMVLKRVIDQAERSTIDLAALKAVAMRQSEDVHDFETAWNAEIERQKNA